jgi:hypothetical protein
MDAHPTDGGNPLNFALVADMAAWPRACCACGHYGAAVDLGVERFDERLYVCSRCVSELLRLVDSDRCPVSERDAALEVAKQATLRAELAEEDVRLGVAVRAELEQARGELAVLRSENLALRDQVAPKSVTPAEAFRKSLEGGEVDARRPTRNRRAEGKAAKAGAKS